MSVLKLLILSVSMGHGHVRAAQALEAGIAEWFPQHEARHVDLLSLIPAVPRKILTNTYIKGVGNYPGLWRFLYKTTDKERRITPLTALYRRLELACNKPLLCMVREYRPDHIICTHFTPMHVLSFWQKKGLFNAPIWTCITDFIAHKYWLETGLAGYFVAAEETEWRMRRQGLRRENIALTGIPVMPEFSHKLSREKGASLFGLDPAQTTLTLMGGGAGMDGLHSLAKVILDPANLSQKFQLVVLAGKNRDLLESLLTLAQEYPGRLFPIPFTKDVPHLFTASDLIITKPGGLTTAECLAVGKPMLAVAPIPGQEEQNAHILLENGATLMATDNLSLLYRLRMLLDAPDFLADMTASALRLGRPFAAKEILETIFKAGSPVQ